MNHPNIGTVMGVTHWTETLFSLQIKADHAPFKAGQYAKLGLEYENMRIQRAYSYVNPPSIDILEFYFVLVPEGKLTPHLHRLQVGDEIQVSHAGNGFFILEEIPECDTLWMLATGTGIGPYLSILQEGLTSSVEAKQPLGLGRFKHLVLVWAVRYISDLSYAPLMHELVEKYQGKLRVQTILSQEHAPDALKGRIPALIESGELESAVGLSLDAKSSHVMLCGNPQMIRDTQEVLLRTREMTKHLRRKAGHVTSEQYW